VLLNVEPHRGAIRRGDWKLVVQGKLPRPEKADPLAYRLELFDLSKDPNEKDTLAGQLPGKADELLQALDGYARQAAPPKGGAADPKPPGWRAPAVYGE